MNEKRIEFLLKYLDIIVGFADDGLLKDIEWASSQIKMELTEVKTEVGIGPETITLNCGQLIHECGGVEELINSLKLRLKNMV